MKLYSEASGFKLYHGSMLNMLEIIKPKSIDSIVTDPPYELNFMNKGWDNSGIAFQKSTWEKCYQVLKPGGYLLAFGGSRTFHRIACAIEDAGFEIRDTIMWIYGSGFPKSMNIAKGIEAKLTTGSANKTGFRQLNGEKVERGNYGYAKMMYNQDGRPKDYNKIDDVRLDRLEPTTEEAKMWQGWGTSLKPAYEPVIVARKPCEGSCIDNVMQYGVGGINIDECRIGDEEISYYPTDLTQAHSNKFGNGAYMPKDTTKEAITHAGRYPSNVILTYDETNEQEVCGGMPETKSSGGRATMPEMSGGELGICDFKTIGASRIETDYVCPMDEGSAARYFYCAKASKRDRDEGLDKLPDKLIAFSNQVQAELRRNNDFNDGGMNKILARKNTHPTVKPCDLMQYLIRLVTPRGGIVLDPFNGSGSTGKACMYENKDRQANYKYIGIELTEEYLPISEARIRHASSDNQPIEIPDEPLKGQISLFDII